MADTPGSTPLDGENGNARTQTTGATPPEALNPPSGPGREPGQGETLPEGADETAHDRAMFRQLAGNTPLETSPGETPPAPSSAGEVPPAPVFPEPVTDAYGAVTQPPSPPPPPAATQPGQGGATEPDGAQRREAERVARAVLQRDGWKGERLDQLIASMPTDELREQTQAARARQRAGDQLGNRVHALEQEMASRRSGGSDGDGGGDGGVSLDNADLSDLTPAQRRLVERYRDLGDDETAILQLEAFREGHAQAATAGNAPGATGRGGDTVADALVQFREPLDRLERMYPQLADQDARAKVLEAANRMIGEGVYDENESPPTILADAAEVVLGAADPNAPQRRLLENHTRQRNGQPTRATQQTPAPPTEPMKPVDAERQAFRELAHGTDVRTVQQHHHERLALPG